MVIMKNPVTMQVTMQVTIPNSLIINIIYYYGHLIYIFIYKRVLIENAITEIAQCKTDEISIYTMQYGSDNANFKNRKQK